MPERKHYDKGALTIEKQLDLLKKRGLGIEDASDAKSCLENISYYHLSGYFKPFQQTNDTFIKGATFNNTLDLYFFDRKLRLIFLDALERIEKSFKTQFIYHLSNKYGSHCLTEMRTFRKHKELIDKNLKNSKEPFIKKFNEKYSNEYPPLWILAEVLSFGDILNVFKRSVDNKDKKEISKHHNLGWQYLYSWLENLREIRNICAHYSRLWNRKITKHLKKGGLYPALQYDGRIFDSIIITSILLKTISPKFKWLDKVKALLNNYEIDCRKMGFPKNWEEIFNNLD